MILTSLPVSFVGMLGVHQVSTDDSSRAETRNRTRSEHAIPHGETIVLTEWLSGITAYAIDQV